MARLEVRSEVTGNVWKIEAAVGDQLENEGVIMILESMKMEIPIEAPAAGRLLELLVKQEDAVDEDQVVVRIRMRRAVPVILRLELLAEDGLLRFRRPVGQGESPVP